jgi:hypothetical protein
MWAGAEGLFERFMGPSQQEQPQPQLQLQLQPQPKWKLPAAKAAAAPAVDVIVISDSDEGEGEGKGPAAAAGAGAGAGSDAKAKAKAATKKRAADGGAGSKARPAKKPTPAPPAPAPAPEPAPAPLAPAGSLAQQQERIDAFESASLKDLRAAAKAGDAAAQTVLARVYCADAKRFDESREKMSTAHAKEDCEEKSFKADKRAFNLNKLAAAAGFAVAQNNLGGCYVDGHGCTRWTGCWRAASSSSLRRRAARTPSSTSRTSRRASLAPCERWPCVRLSVPFSG